MSAEAIRVSPLLGRLQALGARFVETNAMAVAVSIDDADADRAGILGVADLSFLHKTGFKGANAAHWAQQQGLVLPPANSWAQAGDGSIVARLGDSEFLIEDSRQSATCARISAALQTPAEAVYPVRRNDAGFALTGKRVNELLVETCSFNFLEVTNSSVVMTTMVGVSVLVIRHDIDACPCYRIWCDPTMAAYLWDTINDCANEFGGGPIGVDLLPAAPPPE